MASRDMLCNQHLHYLQSVAGVSCEVLPWIFAHRQFCVMKMSCVSCCTASAIAESSLTVCKKLARWSCCVRTRWELPFLEREAKWRTSKTFSVPPGWNPRRPTLPARGTFSSGNVNPASSNLISYFSGRFWQGWWLIINDRVRDSLAKSRHMPTPCHTVHLFSDKQSCPVVLVRTVIVNRADSSPGCSYRFSGKLPVLSISASKTRPGLLEN